MSIYDKRMVLFSGKGGVGKTTLSAAFALSCAQQGQKTLLMELNVKDRLSAIFGSFEVGSEITEIEENLYAVNTTPATAMEEYAMMKLKVKLVYRAVFENKVVSSFLRVIPGLSDLVMLGKAFFHANEKDSRGNYVWDKVVIDAPATGHGIFFLKIPGVITSIIESGPMFGEAQQIEEFLQNPEYTSINLVTLPEEMPVNETIMLRDVIDRELHIPIGFIAANCVYPTVFEEDELSWLEESLDEDDFSEETQGFVDAARFRTQRVGMQQPYLARLQQEMSQPVIEIPYYFTERFDFRTIGKIAQVLRDHLE